MNEEPESSKMEAIEPASDRNSQAASSSKQTDRQAYLTAFLLLIAVSFNLTILATLTVSAFLDRFSAPEWSAFIWLLERSDEVKIGAAAILSLIAVSAMVFTNLYKASSKLNWLFGLIISSIILVFMLLYLTSTDKLIEAIFPEIKAPRFDTRNWSHLPQVSAEAQRSLEIETAISALLYSVLGWLGSTLATALGIQSKIGDAVRTMKSRWTANKG